MKISCCIMEKSSPRNRGKIRHEQKQKEYFHFLYKKLFYVKWDINNLKINTSQNDWRHEIWVLIHPQNLHRVMMFLKLWLTLNLEWWQQYGPLFHLCVNTTDYSPANNNRRNALHSLSLCGLGQHLGDFPVQQSKHTWQVGSTKTKICKPSCSQLCNDVVLEYINRRLRSKRVCQLQRSMNRLSS